MGRSNQVDSGIIWYQGSWLFVDISKLERRLSCDASAAKGTYVVSYKAQIVHQSAVALFNVMATYSGWAAYETDSTLPSGTVADV